MQDIGTQFHIRCNVGDVGRYVFLPGDPGRCEEIAKHFELDIAEVIFTMDSAKMPISIYTPYSDDENKNSFLLDKYAQDNSDDVFDNLILKNALKNLCERDKQIIVLRFFRDKTQSEIAKILGVSQVQVSRLENKILHQMKEDLC